MPERLEHKGNLDFLQEEKKSKNLCIRNAMGRGCDEKFCGQVLKQKMDRKSTRRYRQGCEQERRMAHKARVHH